MGTESADDDLSADTVATIISNSCYLTKTLMLSRSLQAFYEDGLDAHGLTPQQGPLLSTIVALGGAHPSDLARELEIERSTISRNLKILIDRGLLRAELTPAGRTRRVFATDLGHQIIVGFFPAWAMAQEEIVDAIGVERLTTFLEVAEQLRLMNKTAV